MSRKIQLNPLWKILAATFLLFSAAACTPLDGADPLDSGYDSPAPAGSSFRGEYGIEATAEF